MNVSDKTFTYQIRRTDPPPENLLVRFKITRTLFVSLEATDDNGEPLVGHYALGEGDVALAFDAVASTCRSLKINVTYEGEPPVRFPMRGPDALLFVAPPKDLFPELRRKLEAAKKTPPANIGIDKKELKALLTNFDFFKALRSWDKFFAAEADPDLRLYKAFFHNLDLATNSSLHWAIAIPTRQKECYREAIEAAVAVLEPVLAQRVGNANAGGKTLTDISGLAAAAPTVSCSDDQGNKVDEDVAKLVSDLMKPAYLDFFKKRNGVLDREDLARAFCHFANGDLRTGDSLETRMWNCEPDGLQELMFADACIWFIKRNIDTAFWKQVLPCAAASQKFYLRTYRPDRQLAGLDPKQWGAWTYSKSKPVPPDEFDQMFEIEFGRFQGKDVDDISEEIDKNVTEAARTKPLVRTSKVQKR